MDNKTGIKCNYCGEDNWFESSGKFEYAEYCKTCFNNGLVSELMHVKWS